MENYRDFLKHEFDIRKEHNSGYSLRSFARDLQLESSHLSKILNGKKGISIQRSEHVADELGLRGREKDVFLALIELEHGRKKKSRLEAAKFLKQSRKYDQIEMGSFNVISDWKYYAILTVMQLDHYNGDPNWIAGNLNLPTETVTNALELLVELELVKEEENLFWPLAYNFETDTDFPSLALRNAHKQNLNQAIEAIDKYDLNHRDISSMTMAIDIKKLPEAKKRIHQFSKELCDFLEAGEKNTAFNLNVQLYPLTCKEKLQ